MPPLRFPEFTDEWEKQKLSDFVERVTRKNKNNESKLPLTISAQYGLVDQITFFNKVIASNDISGYYLLKKGEFAYNKSYSGDYTWGAVKRLDRYEQGALSTLYICFSPLECVISDYLVHYFETKKWHREVSEIAVEGARNHGLLNIGVADYFNTKHFLPSKKEQKKIAAFLNLIEKRIALQTKIIEDLKKLKSAIIEKLIFGNKDLDEKISIGQIATLKNGYAFKSNSYSIGGKYKIITISNVTGDKYIDTSDCNTVEQLPDDIQEHQVIKENSILISMTGNVGRVSLSKIGNNLLNQRVGLLQLNEGIFTEYIYQVLSTKHFEQSMIGCGQGAAQLNISKYDIESYIIPYSSNIGVIEKVGSILCDFDQKIFVETNILEKLQAQKNYLLQQMFI